MPISELGTGIFGLVIIVFLVVLAILWFCLPFAVFGIKDKLNQMVAIGQRGNKSLADIEARLARLEAERALAKEPA